MQECLQRVRVPGPSGRPTQLSGWAFASTGRLQRRRDLLSRRGSSEPVVFGHKYAGHRVRRLRSFDTRGTEKKEATGEVISSAGQSIPRVITKVLPAPGGGRPARKKLSSGWENFYRKRYTSGIIEKDGHQSRWPFEYRILKLGFDLKKLWRGSKSGLGA